MTECAVCGVTEPRRPRGGADLCRRCLHALAFVERFDRWPTGTGAAGLVAPLERYLAADRARRTADPVGVLQPSGPARR